VTSIVLNDPINTRAGEAHFTVTFSEPVVGLSPSSFSLAVGSGLSAATLLDFAPAGDADGTQYSLTVGTGSGQGSLQIVLDPAGLTGADGTPIQGADGLLHDAGVIGSGNNSGSYGTSFADLDNDGDQDLVVQSFNTGTSVLANDGHGTFSLSASYTVPTNPLTVTLVDVNNDGYVDIVGGSWNSWENNNGGISVLLNDGDGTFGTAATYTGIANGEQWGVAVGDINGDGFADIIVPGSVNSSVAVYLNNGNGTFQSGVDNPSGGDGIIAEVADLDGDGTNDVIVSNIYNGTVSVLLGNGDGTFAAPVSYATETNPTLIATGDLNGDNKVDMVVGSQSGNVSVFLNNGDGTLSSAVPYSNGTNSYSLGAVALADLDGDGKLDLITDDGGAIRVREGAGDGSFGAATDYATNNSNYGDPSIKFAVGDADGDGDLDIALADWSTSGIRLLLNGPVPVTSDAYSVDHVAPTGSAVADVGAGNMASLFDFTVTFDEAVTNLSIGSFELISTGSARGTVSGITGSGSTYTITVTGIAGTGELSLALSDNAGITDSVGNPLSLLSSTSHEVALNSAPTGLPVAVGTAQQGQVLNADLSGLSDADGFDPAAVSYQWQRNDGPNGAFVDVAGAAAARYALTQADVGHQLQFVASYTDALNTPEAVTSGPTATVANINDAPLGLPVATGTAQQGQMLSTDLSGLSDVDGFDPAVVSFQWQRNDGPNGAFVDVAGAAAATYALTQADVGHQLQFVASYTDALNTPEAVTSIPTAAVANVNDLPIGLPVTTGTAQQGQVLSADLSGLSDADGFDRAAVSFQWQRNDGPNGAFVDVAGAAAATYALTQADVDHQLQFVASYTDTLNTPEAVTSGPTAAVANINDAPSGEIILSGASIRGSVLTGASTLADADGLGPLTYQWQRDNGAGGHIAIDGANSSSYALSREDIGHSIHLAVSYTDGGGTAEETTSIPTPVVFARNISVEPLVDGVSRTVSLTSGEVAAKLADGDILTPPDQTQVIELADGSLSFGTTTDAAFLTRLYSGLLGRSGETNGLSFWTHGTDGNLNKLETATGFLASVEYQAANADHSDIQFVEDLYQGMLGRTGDAEGIADHLQALAAGTSRAQILVNFADAPEAQAHWSETTSTGIFVPGEHAGLIRAAYAAAFGREAEATGLTWHGQALANGQTAAEFGDAIAASPEFLALHGNQSDHDLLADLYVNGLGREGTAQEILFYERLLANQTLDSGDVVIAFAASAEAQAHQHWAL
jgi:hypothetical protein